MGNSPAKQSDALRQQLATMNEELQAFDQQILTKKARLAELRPFMLQSTGGPQTDVEIEFSELGAAISEAEGRRDDLGRFALPSLEKRLKFILEVEGAEGEIRAAKAEQAAARDESNAHVARRGHVLAKIAEIEAGIELTNSQALEAEQSAAAAYARAVVEGDEGAQQAADAQFLAAQEATKAAEHQVERKRGVLVALQKETAHLDALKSAADERVAAAAVKLSRSLEVKHAVEWNAAVEELARIGALLGAARLLRGESLRDLLHGLNVNRLGPEAIPLRVEEVSRLVDSGVIPAVD